MNKEGKVVDGGIKEHTVCDTPYYTSVRSAQENRNQAQCIANLGNVLTAAGSSWEKVLKVNVYLKNMDDFIAMNEVSTCLTDLSSK